MKALSLDAIFSSFGSRADGSMSFRGTTPKLSTAEKVALMELHSKNVKLLIQPVDEEADSIVEVKMPLGFKSPGQRLRSVLFILFKQQAPPDTTFDEFYTRRMEDIIERQKKQLAPE